ncbi:DoxX family protein [Opitutus terrae]|uniref:DoxX family protein n=1 Tax=Opitutus terrae (strain DSM 11246 / JCM 15787 / PB90-1) TaxID=452637 RepID=B2A039_OPITP|nr:DoxX family protein [Opitutus terrae]ACB77375.1 DoxX family protein [Opitutus terrae PB90-1]
MNKLLRFLQLNFIPRSTDLGLLVLRLWLGLSLLTLHGWAKLTGFGSMAGKFPDPIGMGPTVSLGLAVFAEVVCAALLALGLLTRFAALVLIIMMGVAFLVVHGRALSGPGSGEMAYLYLAGFVTVFLAGPGAYAVDRKLGARI